MGALIRPTVADADINQAVAGKAFADGPQPAAGTKGNIGEIIAGGDGEFVFLGACDQDLVAVPVVGQPGRKPQRLV